MEHFQNTSILVLDPQPKHYLWKWGPGMGCFEKLHRCPNMQAALRTADQPLPPQGFRIQER